VTALRRSGSLTVRSATRSSTWTSTGSDTRLSLTIALFVVVLDEKFLGVVVLVVVASAPPSPSAVGNRGQSWAD
jgi:hypothetical protein